MSFVMFERPHGAIPRLVWIAVKAQTLSNKRLQHFEVKSSKMLDFVHNDRIYIDANMCLNVILIIIVFERHLEVRIVPLNGDPSLVAGE